MTQTAQFFPEEKRDDGGADEVDEKRRTCVASVHSEVVDAVQCDAHHDKQQLQDSKFDGTLLEAQIGEGNTLESVDGHAGEHTGNIFGMVTVLHQVGNRLQENHRQHDEQKRRRTHRPKRCGIDSLGIFALLVGIAEKSGFHAIGQDDEQQRNIGIDVRNHAILAAFCRHFHRVERHEQVVQESPDDARKAIDGGVFN